MKHTSHKGLTLISFQWTRVANLLHAECDLREERGKVHVITAFYYSGNIIPVSDHP